MRRTRMLHRAGLAAMLAAAALALPACWGKVYRQSNGERLLIIPGDVSDTIIWSCSKPGWNAHSRGFCALSTVRNLCNGVPLDDLPLNWCVSFTWTDHIFDVAEAIDRVVGPNHDCLAVRFDIPEEDRPRGNPNDWVALPLGFGCTRGHEQLPPTG